MNETQQCHYCKEEYPYPVELHHSETECALNTIADLQRQLADMERRGDSLNKYDSGPERMRLESVGDKKHQGKHIFDAAADEIIELRRQLADAQAQKGELIERAARIVEDSPTYRAHSDRPSLCHCSICAYVRGNVTEIRALDSASTSAWNERLRRERLDELARMPHDSACARYTGEGTNFLNPPCNCWKSKRPAALSAPEDRHGTSEG